MARTNTLGNFLTDVAEAIRTKKGTSETIQASNFDTEIANLPSGGDMSDYFGGGYSGGNVTRVGDWYTYIKKLENIVPSTANVSYLFQYFRGSEIDLTGVINYLNTQPTSTPISYGSMFSNCINLKEVDLKGVTKGKASNCGAMFNGCTSLKIVDLSTIENQSFSSQNMFYNCTSLEKIDVRNFDFSLSTNFSGMFTNVPANCLIIVKDQTQKDWINTNFSNLTNVMTVEEYEASLNN